MANVEQGETRGAWAARAPSTHPTPPHLVLDVDPVDVSRLPKRPKLQAGRQAGTAICAVSR